MQWPRDLNCQERTFGAGTNVMLREQWCHRENQTGYHIMVVGEVLLGGVKARLFVLCAHGFLNYSGRTETLGRLDTGRCKQRSHLLHRTKNIAVGFYSSKPFLYRAVWGQPQIVAQGRPYLAAGVI